MRYGIRGLIFGLALCGLLAHGENSPPKDAGFIGVMLSRPPGSDFPIVEYVAKGSPAANAGIMADDRITAIDGASTVKMNAADARHALEGDIGVNVNLIIKRLSETKPIVVERKSLEDTFLPAVKAGDMRAEDAIGFFYERGPASVVDPGKAAGWYWSAAAKGDAAGERSLGILYMNGQGVPQLDKQAFNWFYSAAVQGDARAQYYLGLFYQNGRGTKADQKEAFHWYKESAEQGTAYAQWNLGYAYEKGLGVKANSGEALKWFLKAGEGLPDNEKLRKHIAVISLKAFVDNPESVKLNPALFMAVYGARLVPFFYALFVIYALGGLVLFYFSFRAVITPVAIPVALGWLVFQMAGQAVALAVLLMAGASLTASGLFVATCFFGAVPVIVSTLGPNRTRLWQASATSWKALVAYGFGAYVINLILLTGYAKIYTILSHSALPGQPTEVLISKAKHGSVWLAFACIAVALPLTEEILFRGYLFESLKKRLPEVWVIILTAFAFSLVHLQGLYFAPLFGFGLVQGWIRWKTGSLRLPVFLHVLNNTLFIAVSS